MSLGKTIALILLMLHTLNFNAGHADYILTEQPTETIKIPQTEYLGVYTITAYCHCIKCCGKCDGITASGEMVKEGITVACDLPFGVILEIEGLGERVVQDRGVSGKHIDVYFSEHEEAVRFGVKELRVWRR